jgi:5-methylcytosine-specific restriction protein A
LPRSEFSKPTRREALKRSGGYCEAVGKAYGLPSGHRCNAPLSHGVEFDHYPVPATERDSDGLDNCVTCCKACHGFKTRTLDIPIQAKTKRVSDKHNGIRQPSRMRGPGFRKTEPQHTATRALRKDFS